MPSNAAANGTGEMALCGRIGRDEVQERRTGAAPRPVSGFRWAACWRLAISRPTISAAVNTLSLFPKKNWAHNRRIQGSLGSLMSLSGEGGEGRRRGADGQPVEAHHLFLVPLIFAQPRPRPGTEARWGVCVGSKCLLATGLGLGCMNQTWKPSSFTGRAARRVP